jgi:hypothetical protein
MTSSYSTVGSIAAVVASQTSTGVLGGTAHAAACFTLPPNPHPPRLSRRRQRQVPNVPTMFAPTTPSGIQRLSTNLDMNGRRRRDNNGNDDDNILVSLIDRTLKTVSKPVPGVSPSLAIGYPLALIAAALVLPTTTAAFLALFFCVYAILGRRLILEDDFDEDDDDDEDEESRPRTDLLAFGAAVVSAGLLAPTNSPVDISAAAAAAGDSTPLLAVGSLGLAAAAVVVLLRGDTTETNEATESIEQKLMDMWDDKLRQEGDDDR